LIGGANETGKSTLIEALHRTLFLKATSTGSPVEALRSKINLGHPTVEIKFQAKEEIYLLRKCFTGSSGQITLLNEISGNTLSGPKAEEYLAGLIGVKESLGSRQAGSLLPKRWAHLWVMQGSAGNDLLKADKSSYEFDSLLLQLEKKGGAAIQISANDQRVLKKINDEINKNFTSKSIRKNSPLDIKAEELVNAKNKLDIAISNLKEYEQSSEELVGINEKIEEIQNIRLPELLEQRNQISKVTEERKLIEAQINLASKTLEPIKLRYETSQKVLKRFNHLLENIKTKEEEKKLLKQRKIEQAANELILTNSLKTKKEIIPNLKVKLTFLEKSLLLAQILLDKSRLLETILRLKKELKKSKTNLEKINTIKNEIASLSKIERIELNQLRDLNHKIQNNLARQEMLNTEIKLIRSNQSIRVDGEEISPGDQKQFSHTFELQIGDNISLEIRPGGGDAINSLKGHHENLFKEFSQILSKLNLGSLKDAENEFEKRLSLEQQLSLLELPSEVDIKDKQKQIYEKTNRIAELENDLLEFGNYQDNMFHDQLIPSTVDELEEFKQRNLTSRNNISSSLDQANQLMEFAQSELQTFRESLIEEESKLKIIDNDLNTLRESLLEIQKNHSNQEKLKSEIRLLEKELLEVENNLSNLNNRIISLEEINNLNDIEIIDAKIHAIEEDKERLIAEKGSAQRNCFNISSSDPYAAIEQAKVNLENIKIEYQTLRRITDSHKLLKDLFSNVQTNLSSKYTKPLANAISNYLKPLIDSETVVQLEFDQATGFNGLKMRRGKEFYDFDQLSGGMREQLAAALRLSIADVLKSEHNGCLPLVFDDAFTNSDPERIKIVKHMIKSAADNGLQIILLTCEPKSYESFADEEIILSQ
tara:strand:- start:5015 stop:7654 length:2640 start_codon:yes stop_codon:yes gene_type:complete